MRERGARPGAARARRGTSGRARRRPATGTQAMARVQANVQGENGLPRVRLTNEPPSHSVHVRPAQRPVQPMPDLRVLRQVDQKEASSVGSSGEKMASPTTNWRRRESK